MDSGLKSTIKYLQSENLDIDYKEFVFQVESHPDYPSLLSFSDTLTFFGVKNMAVKTDSFSVDLLPNSFIALFRDNGLEELSFIEISESNLFKDGRQIPQAEIKKKWGGIVFVADDESNSVLNKKKKSYKWRLPLLLASILLISTIMVSGMFFPSHFYFFLIICITGLFLAVEASRQALGEVTILSEGLCKSMLDSDCSSVLKSKEWGFLKILDPSDLTVVFFSGQLTSFVILESFGYHETFFTLFRTGLFLVLPISLMSLYYQWKIIKQWCPICLMILGVFYIELIYFTNTDFSYHVSTKGLFLFLGIYSLIFSIWSLVKSLIKSNQAMTETIIETMRFKRNYELFLLALKSEDKLADDSIQNAFHFGNTNSKLIIGLVTNPFCGYCPDAHEIIEELLMKYGEEVHVVMRFNFNIRPELHSAEYLNRLYLHRTLVAIYEIDGPGKFLLALKFWFENNDLDEWKRRFKQLIEEYEVDNVLNAQYSWCLKNELLFTPAITVGNRKYPNTYQRKDLLYFLNDLLDDKANFNLSPTR